MQRSAKSARAKHFVVSAMAARLARKLWPRAFIANEIAAMAVTVALALPFIIGVMGIGIETSYWRIHQRSMQYAADAAAIAAATNEGPTYQAEALAVAAQKEIAGKAGPQADGIVAKVGQVHEMDRIGEDQVVALGRRVQLLPESHAALSASFGGEHRGTSTR